MGIVMDLTIKKLKEKLKNDDVKRLFENFASLFTLQGLNYILPLITFPYLVRVLGPDKYGLIAFAQAFISYFVILTDYGFNLSATREVALNRDDDKKLSEIFSSVVIIKVFFMMISFVLLCLIVFSFEKFRQDWIIYVFTFGIVVGNALFPVWFFQGMERMRYITFLNIISKTIFTISIFIFIKNSSDYLYVPLINSLGYLIVGVLSLWVVNRKFAINIIFPKLSSIKHHLIEGWYIFLSTLVVSFYRILPQTALGMYHNYEIVGYYAIGEKIIRAIVGLLQPVNQAIFPFISRKMKCSTDIGVKTAMKFLKYIIVITFLMSASTFIFAEEITYLIAGNVYNKSVIAIKILSFLPLFIGVANIFGVQIMLNIGLKKEFTYILVVGGLLSLILLFILVPSFEIVGASVAVILAEFLVMIMMVYSVVRNLKKRKKEKYMGNISTKVI
jgi:PST family polysaccharide transporter